MKSASTAATLLTLVSIGQCYGPHHPRGPHVHRRPTPSNAQSNPTLDKEIFHDEVHINEDFENIELRTNEMNLPELASYYFMNETGGKVPTKFTPRSGRQPPFIQYGLEILQALKHTMHEEDENVNLNSFSLSERDLQYYVELVDKLLSNEDLDGDGYLSYTEYILAQQQQKEQEKV